MSFFQDTATGHAQDRARGAAGSLRGMADACKFKFVNDLAMSSARPRTQPNQHIDSGSRHSSCWA